MWATSTVSELNIEFARGWSDPSSGSVSGKQDELLDAVSLRWSLMDVIILAYTRHLF